MSNTNDDEIRTRYESALASGDPEKIRESEAEIHQHLYGNTPSEEAGSPAPQVDATPKTEEAPPSTPEAITEADKPVVAENVEAPAKEGEASTPTSTDTSDWLASLPESTRSQVIKALDYERSARQAAEGRLNSVNKLNVEKERYRKEAEELRTQLEKAKTSPTPTNSTKPNLPSSHLEELERTDPELAKVLKAEREALLAALESVKSVPVQVPTSDPNIQALLEKVQRIEEERVLTAERDRLEQMVPGALKVLDYVETKPDGKVWSPWWEFVDTLPPKLQTLVDDTSAETYAYLMRLYGQWAEGYNASKGFTSTHASTASTPAQTTPAQVDPQAAQVQAQRDARLRTPTVTGGTTAAPTSREPTMEEILADPKLLAKFQKAEMDKALRELGYQP